MDLDYLERIKRLAIIAMFSDDDLMDLLVLKGGNVLDLVLGITPRASLDLDFSIESEFDYPDLIRGKIQHALKRTFDENGYHAFDIKMWDKPPSVSADMKHFWGGYTIEFKLIEAGKRARLGDHADLLRRNAAIVGPNHLRTFSIDISKHEFCRPGQERDMDGYTIHVYTPEMVAFEKLRAICQQMPEYGKIVRSQSQSARAKDFFDIYIVSEHFQIDFSRPDNIDLVKAIFQAKRVPANLIPRISQHKAYHQQDFASVRDTVKPGTNLENFDFYFDYVVRKARDLHPLWDE